MANRRSVRNLARKPLAWLAGLMTVLALAGCGSGDYDVGTSAIATEAAIDRTDSDRK